MLKLDEEGLYRGEVKQLEDGSLELDITLESEGSGIYDIDSTIIVFLTQECNPINIRVFRLNRLSLMRMDNTNDYLGNDGIYRISIIDYFTIEKTKQTVMFINIKPVVKKSSV
ncbi:hypothetical protein [Ureibacillus chungkukjangi]|uniref:Uncharacterized protein n=1 Tax=Ureibacillus chungkukjangi TaxID=1202712 RepID=A0A318TY03_9BACL|nr:hypothetical protein [Ureibacillus chungkukjangi]PYF07888.1 hypothetical protein BJ095_10355 [Ureibacillus chungkukjangi]